MYITHKGKFYSIEHIVKSVNLSFLFYFHNFLNLKHLSSEKHDKIYVIYFIDYLPQNSFEVNKGKIKWLQRAASVRSYFLKQFCCKITSINQIFVFLTLLAILTASLTKTETENVKFLNAFMSSQNSLRFINVSAVGLAIFYPNFVPATARLLWQLPTLVWFQLANRSFSFPMQRFALFRVFSLSSIFCQVYLAITTLTALLFS